MGTKKLVGTALDFCSGHGGHCCSLRVEAAGRNGDAETISGACHLSSCGRAEGEDDGQGESEVVIVDAVLRRPRRPREPRDFFGMTNREMQNAKCEMRNVNVNRATEEDPPTRRRHKVV